MSFLQVIIAHPIQDKNRQISYFNLLDNFKLGFALSALYLLSLLAVMASGLLINALTHRIRFGGQRIVRLSKRFALVLNSFKKKKLSAIGLFVLFVQLFCFNTQLFLTNNIKTNKVVVDTTHLIRNERDIFNSRKVACLLQDGQVYNLILSSPTKNILTKIFHEKTQLRPDMQRERAILQKSQCLLFRNPKVFQVLNSDVFFVAELTLAHLMLGMTSLLNKVFNSLWISEESIFEYNLVSRLDWF